MIELHVRPRLASKARLRKDAKSGRYLLLYPERGMELNGTGADILQLCTGEATVADIVDTLARRYAPTPRDAIEREVLSFLNALGDRALLV
jgi:pyrroloquinoline quinone biosynthesis protein D